MSTNNSHKGASNIHPNKATIPAGSEVTAPPSAVVPTTAPAGTPPAAESTTVNSASALLAVEATVKSCREGYVPILATLREALRSLANESQARTPPVPAPRKQAATLYAELLREYPTLTSSVSPDGIDAGLALDAALAMVKDDFQKVLPTVESSGRVSARVSWHDAAVVRSAAKAQPHKDADLVARIASIEALLHQGKRVATSANAAAKAQTAATKAQQKAARAAAKAARKAQTAARTAQVHAENHPVTPDVVIVPATTTPKP